MQSKDNGIYSAIDIGTNTCLLLIAELKDNTLTKIYEALKTPRLGKDLYSTGKISKEAFQRTLEILKHYISVSEGYGAKKIFAFGTSAMRDAKNRDEFIEFIKSGSGIKIKVISGIEESRYGYEGATFDLEKNRVYVVLDIGGGSTEISYMDGDKLISESIDVGSVRIYENYFKGNFDKINLDKANKFIEDNLPKININPSGKDPVGIAGTVTTLSAIKNGLMEFDEASIHRDILTFEEVENILSKLISMTEKERLNIGNYMKGRSDIIICGAMILKGVMEHLKFSSVTVSTKGLRYGYLLNIQDFI